MPRFPTSRSPARWRRAPSAIPRGLASTSSAESILYREVGDLVRRAAKGFAGLGVRPGVRVGLMLPNTPYYVIAYYAVLAAGGTVVKHQPASMRRRSSATSSATPAAPSPSPST